jgi:hypothetical protein
MLSHASGRGNPPLISRRPMPKIVTAKDQIRELDEKILEITYKRWNLRFEPMTKSNQEQWEKYAAQVEELVAQKDKLVAQERKNAEVYA